MTDQPFQPGQPVPPVQGWGVFWGNAEETVQTAAPFQTQPSQEPEFTITHEDLVPEVIPTQETMPIQEETSPFDGYTIPQDIPVVKETKEIIPEEPVIEEPVTKQTVSEEAPKEVKSENVSDTQQKYTQLLTNVSRLYSLLKRKEGEFVEVIGANNDTISLLYQFGVNDQNEVFIKRIETKKDDEESSFNELKLALNPETHLFEIFLDEVLLFEESDLLEDAKKKSQVMEKLNKFIFLTESKIKDTEKDLKAKEEEEHERRRLQDIFRNF